MAESTNFSAEDEEDLQQAIKVNGRYVDPWGTARLPSKCDALRWKFREKNERGIGGTWKELFRFKNEVQNIIQLASVLESIEIFTVSLLKKLAYKQQLAKLSKC